MSKRILICDDHSLFGYGIQGILERHHYSVKVVQSSDECISQIRNSSFEVILVDLNIDERTGFDIFNETKNQLGGAKIFLLTAYDEPHLVEKCQKLGFNGFLRKETSTHDLIVAIEMENNSPFFNPINSPTNQSKSNFKDIFSTQSIKLSPQEKEIIRQIVSGGTSKSIAEKLFISKLTVDTHRRNIYRKLEITGISSLIRFANENMLIR